MQNFEDISDEFNIEKIYTYVISSYQKERKKKHNKNNKFTVVVH